MLSIFTRSNTTKLSSRSGKLSRKISPLRRKEEIAGILFLIPNFLGVASLIMLPLFAALGLAFTEWNPALGLDGIRFVGFDNFERMLRDSRVWESLRNNLVYTFTYVPFSIGLAAIFANLLNRYVFLKTPLRLMIFMPYISSMVSVAIVWMVLLFPHGGPVNAILTNVFGIASPPTWFISTRWALVGFIIMGVWHSVGYFTIILLAGIQNIPAELYEAANIDGCSGVQQFFRITIPMLAPTMFFTTILATIISFRVFDQIHIITGGGPGRATSVLVYAIYFYAFMEHRFGYASAVALLLVLITFTLSMIQMKMRKHFSY